MRTDDSFEQLMAAFDERHRRTLDDLERRMRAVEEQMLLTAPSRRLADTSAMSFDERRDILKSRIARAEREFENRNQARA